MKALLGWRCGWYVSRWGSLQNYAGSDDLIWRKRLLFCLMRTQERLYCNLELKMRGIGLLNGI